MNSNDTKKTPLGIMKSAFFLFLASVLLGFVWNMGSDFGLIFIHLIAPCFQGLFAATLLRDMGLKNRLLVLPFSVLLTNLTRVTAYFYQGGAPSLMKDGETRLVMVISFSEQVLLAFFIFVVAVIVDKLFRRKHNTSS